jgi:hypothetical protein
MDLDDPARVWQAAVDLDLPVDELLAFVARQADTRVQPANDRVQPGRADAR